VVVDRTSKGKLMPSNIEQARNWISRLDRCASMCEKKFADLGLTADQGVKMASKIDLISDAIEIKYLGKESFKARVSGVLNRDPDESYMDSFSEDGVIDGLMNWDEFMADFKNQDEAAIPPAAVSGNGGNFASKG